MADMEIEDLSFENLALAIQQIHAQSAEQAVKAVNVSLTLRNWIIGFYIREYELGGSDRAAYVEHLLENLASHLQKMGIKRVETRELRRYRQFYLAYPQIRETLTPEFTIMLPGANQKRETSTPDFAQNLLSNIIWQSPSAKFPANDAIVTNGATLVEKLSFSHLVEMLKLDDSLKRTFYETECIRGNWSVRELKRQIASLYYERSGLSNNKTKLAELANSNVKINSTSLNIRDPYIFEFLNLKSKEVMGESELEDSLLDELQNFLLELGHGFCFEARQKRILIGDEYFFVDMVFYHRILKCHVLIELKVDNFSHENIGQLNTYVNWYLKNEMSEGDNPPIGILLCTKKNNALVEYALAGMDNKQFVSKYQLELPEKEEMQKFLEEKIR